MSRIRHIGAAFSPPASIRLLPSYLSAADSAQYAELAPCSGIGRVSLCLSHYVVYTSPPWQTQFIAQNLSCALMFPLLSFPLLFTAFLAGGRNDLSAYDPVSQARTRPSNTHPCTRLTCCSICSASVIFSEDNQLRGMYNGVSREVQQ